MPGDARAPHSLQCNLVMRLRMRPPGLKMLESLDLTIAEAIGIVGLGTFILIIGVRLSVRGGGDLKETG